MEIFDKLDVDGWLHAVDLDTGDEVGFGADDQVVIASVVKVLLVLEFARQVTAGQLDPAERVVVRPADRLGGWGTAGCSDDVELSLRDLAYFAMSVSDNTAADLLARRVGLDLLPVLAAELGLARTQILGSPRQLLESVFADVGARDAAEFARIFAALPDDQVRALRIYDPARTNSSTPRELTRLLTLIWQDRAGPPSACVMVRDWMSRQLSRTRLASGFAPHIQVAGKTGTLPGLQLEAGVVEYPGGGRYAVAIGARTRRPDTRAIDVDLAIGQVAHQAVGRLRTV